MSVNTIIIDRDAVSAQLLASRLEKMGYNVSLEPDRNKGLEKIAREHIELVLIDPAPLNSCRPVVLNIRRMVEKQPYILLLGDGVSNVDAVSEGANDFIAKPVNPELLEEKLGNVKRMRMIETHFSQTDHASAIEELPGILPRSAVYQLFLALLDRADRYGERSYVLFVKIANPESLKGKADQIIQNLAQHLNSRRRKSDIIGRSGLMEFVFLLQRPASEQEPAEAAARMAEMLGSGMDDDLVKELTGATLNVDVVEVPTGASYAHYNLTR